MTRILRVSGQQVGRVGPTSGTTGISSLQRGAQSLREGARAFDGVADRAAALFSDMLEEDQSNSDAQYVADVDVNEELWNTEHEERFNADPAAYWTEAEARHKEILTSAKGELTDKQFGLLQIGLKKERARRFSTYSDRARVINRRTTISKLNQQIETKHEQMTNEARELGTAGLPSLLEDLVILDNNVAEGALGGNLNQELYANGDSALTRLQDQMEILKVGILSNALLSDAEKLMADPTDPGSYDTAKKFLNDFERTGKIVVTDPTTGQKAEVDTSDISPMERTLAAGSALQGLARLYNTTSNIRTEANDEIVRQDQLRQTEAVLKQISVMRDSQDPMNLQETMLFVAENNLDAAHAAQLWNESAKIEGNTDSAEDAMLIGEMIGHVRSNAGKYTVENAMTVFGQERFLGLRSNAQAIARLYSEINSQQDGIRTHLSKMQSAANALRQGNTLIPDNNDHKYAVDYMEENGLSTPDGAVILPPIPETASAEEMTSLTPTLVNWIRDTGIISKRVNGLLTSAMTDESDPQRAVAGAKMYVAIVDSLPAVITSQLNGDVQAFYDQVASTLAHTANENEAVQRVRSKAFGPSQGDSNRTITLESYLDTDDPREWLRDELKDAMEERIGFWTDVFGLLPEPNGAMLDFAEDRLQRKAKRYLDPEVALRSVARELEATWGPSSFSRHGEDEFAYKPVEKKYTDRDGLADYIRWQVADFATAILQDGISEPHFMNKDDWIDNYGITDEEGGWWLKVDNRDDRTMAFPGYNIHYIDDQGIERVILNPDTSDKARFYPDPTKSRDVLLRRNLAAELHDELTKEEAGIVVTAIAALPGGEELVLEDQIVTRNMIDYMKRGRYNRAVEWLKQRAALMQNQSFDNKGAISQGIDEAFGTTSNE